MIDFDEAKEDEFAAADRLELAKRITRPRAVRILEILCEAREVIINTHPEPETVRHCYNSEWIMAMCEKDPDVIDPRGTLRFLHKIDELFEELGIGEEPDPAFTRELPPGDEEGREDL